MIESHRHIDLCIDFFEEQHDFVKSGWLFYIFRLLKKIEIFQVNNSIRMFIFSIDLFHQHVGGIVQREALLATHLKFLFKKNKKPEEIQSFSIFWCLSDYHHLT